MKKKLSKPAIVIFGELIDAASIIICLLPLCLIHTGLPEKFHNLWANAGDIISKLTLMAATLLFIIPYGIILKLTYDTATSLTDKLCAMYDEIESESKESEVITRKIREINEKTEHTISIRNNDEGKYDILMDDDIYDTGLDIKDVSLVLDKIENEVELMAKKI